MNNGSYHDQSFENLRSFPAVIVVASLLLHLLFGLALEWFVPPQSLKMNHPSYVELLEKPKPPAPPSKPEADEQRFVRKAVVPEDQLTKEKKKARFASESEQNVIEERRARANDLTANRAAEGKDNSRQAVVEKTGQDGKSEKKNLNLSPTTPLEKAKDRLLHGKPASAAGEVRVAGLQPKSPDEPANEAERERGRESQPNMPSTGAQEKGISSVGEMLPNDIKFGDFTALNTDRHLFYSFYARMEELIRYRWVTYARASVESLSPQAIKQLGKENLVTKIEVILDPKGHFVRAILHEGSGLKSLDDAPILAFREAHNFPNPPSEMVKDDGMIHIFYAFNVYGLR